MKAMASTQPDRILPYSTYAQAQFLTNGLCEDARSIRETVAQSLALDSQSSEDHWAYPLSSEERLFITDQSFDIDGNRTDLRMGHSALLSGKKYLVPTIATEVEESQPNSPFMHPQSIERLDKATAIADRIAQVTGGFYFHSAQIPEHEEETVSLMITEIFIPIAYAKGVADSLDSWQAHLREIVTTF